MQIDIFHRHNLSIAAASSAAFYTKYRPQRRFPQRNYRLFTHSGQRISQTNSSGGFPFTGRCWIDGSYQYQLTIRLVLIFFQHPIINFCFIFSIVFYIIILNLQPISNFIDDGHLCFLRNFNIAFKTHNSQPPVKCLYHFIYIGIYYPHILTYNIRFCPA